MVCPIITARGEASLLYPGRWQRTVPFGCGAPAASPKVGEPAFDDSSTGPAWVLCADRRPLGIRVMGRISRPSKHLPVCYVTFGNDLNGVRPVSVGNLDGFGFRSRRRAARTIGRDRRPPRSPAGQAAVAVARVWCRAERALASGLGLSAVRPSIAVRPAMRSRFRLGGIFRFWLPATRRSP